jgi:hypothetical protein
LDGTQVSGLIDGIVVDGLCDGAVDGDVDGFFDGREVDGDVLGDVDGDLLGAAITVTPEMEIPAGMSSNDATNPADSATCSAAETSATPICT